MKRSNFRPMRSKKNVRIIKKDWFMDVSLVLMENCGLVLSLVGTMATVML
jgi:hypothetical protein